jgi:hypothetical protein
MGRLRREAERLPGRGWLPEAGLRDPREHLVTGQLAGIVLLVLRGRLAVNPPPSTDDGEVTAHRPNRPERYVGRSSRRTQPGSG